MKRKIIIRAPALSQSGYGEQSRFALRSLKKYDEYFDLFLINTNWGATNEIIGDSEERRWIDYLIIKTMEYQQKNGNAYDISLQITIPNEWEKMAPINIGYTAGIETNKISPQWVEKTQMMDRIIVVSNHAKYGFENTTYDGVDSRTGQEIKGFRCNVPIQVVNYPVRQVHNKQIELNLTTNFNFLTIVQWGPRKNVENTIMWFVEEFIDNENVGLILKMNSRNNSVMDRHFTESRLSKLLHNYPQRKCKIYLLHGDMSEEDLSGLYNHEKVKALISLSHGEGFGLPVFEAAYHGLPVITTLWSGPCDFMTIPIKDKKTKKIENRPYFAKVKYNLSPIQQEAIWDTVLIKDSVWAFPEQGSYKMRLREVYKEYSRFEGDAKKLKRYIEKNFTDEKYKEFVESVLGTKIVVVDKKDIPKVSIFTSVYNGGDVLQGYIDNVVEQTIFDKMEVVLVHSKESKDFEKEYEILKPYLEKYNNIKYIVPEEKDEGVYWGWSIGVENCTGEYCGNRNLDDRMAKDMIEKMAVELVKNPDVGLIYTDSLITDKFNETMENNTSAGRRYNFPEYSFENLKMLNLPHCNPLYRRELHEKYGNYNKKYKFSGDWECFLRFASNGIKFKKINELLGLYCFSSIGVTTNPARFKEKRAEEKEVYNKYKDVKL